tara:strand:- start:367 stop:675 length:309 start_codon:yes stop_codon:yes gene_type:complete
MAYATAKHTWGISDRSGFRYRLKDMRKEWTGALVGPDEFDPKQPQLYSPHIGPDPESVRNPRPPNDKIPSQIQLPAFNLTSLEYELIPICIGKVGTVTVETS